MQPLTAVRRAFAETLRQQGPIRSDQVVEAFAVVPREAFAGPPPWRVVNWPSMEASEVRDPAELYGNSLISLVASKGLNNGEPLFWARLFDRLTPRPGERVVHVGAGGGYYTAILAEMVGSSGRVTGIEIEPELAARARGALAPWPQAEVVQASALEFAFDPTDVIAASAGFSDVPTPWLERLNPAGRMLIPLTADGEWRMPDGGLWAGGWGAMLLTTRVAQGFAAAFIGPTSIYPCIGGRSAESNGRLHAALQAGGTERVRSLRVDSEPDDSCWLAGEGWWLSTTAIA